MEQDFNEFESEVDAVDPIELPAKIDKKEEEQTQLVKVEQPKPPVAADQNGLLMGSNIEAQFRIAQAFFKSRVLPKQFDTIEKTLAGMQFCYELGLKPMTGLKQVAIINGTCSIWGELPLGLVRRSGALDYIREQLFTEDYKEISFENKNLDEAAFRAVCSVRRKGFPDLITRSFSMKDAEFAGILKNVWKIYPKRMLQMRARSWALKDAFPDILSGITIAEYDMNVTVDATGDVVGETKRDVAAEINQKYLASE